MKIGTRPASGAESSLREARPEDDSRCSNVIRQPSEALLTSSVDKKWDSRFKGGPLCFVREIQHGNNPDCSISAFSDWRRRLGLFAVAQLTQLTNKLVHLPFDPICGASRGERSAPWIDRGDVSSFSAPRTKSNRGDAFSRKTKVVSLLCFQERRALCLQTRS